MFTTLIDSDAQPCVSGHHFRTNHKVICKLLATGVNTVHLSCWCLAADHLVLKLDVGWLVY